MEILAKPHRNGDTARAGLGARIGFAFAGTAAGVAALVLLLFVTSVVPALWNHPTGDRAEAAGVLGVMVIGSIAFALAGCVLVGVPLALAFPARRVARMPWPLWFVTGPLLGVLALLSVSLLMTARDSQPGAQVLLMTKILWQPSVLVSTVAFTVYATLLRRRIGRS
jgi:hypothetical protein